MVAPGTLLQNRYLIIRLLGQGGMGTVYLARETTLGQKLVAIKSMQLIADLTPAQRDNATREFEKEATLLARVSHPGLVAVTDFFKEGDAHYLVLAFVDGQNLQDVLNQASRPLEVPTVLGWMEQICDTMSYLHNQSPPILVRDLKPGNIMLSSHNRLVLIDFGLARLYDQSQTATFIRGMGTPGYAPPEQYGQGGSDARTDIYALGATLYSLLTRARPPASIDRMGGTARLQPPSELNPRVGRNLEAVILKAMAVPKADRYATVDALARDLQACRSDSDVPVVATSQHALRPASPDADYAEPTRLLPDSLPVTERTRVARPKTMNRSLLAAGGALLLVVALVLLRTLSAPPGGEPSFAIRPLTKPHSSEMLSRVAIGADGHYVAGVDARGIDVIDARDGAEKYLIASDDCTAVCFGSDNRTVFEGGAEPLGTDENEPVAHGHLRSWTIDGVPVKDDGTVPGAVLQVKALHSLLVATTEGFHAYQIDTGAELYHLAVTDNQDQINQRPTFFMGGAGGRTVVPVAAISAAGHLGAYAVGHGLTIWDLDARHVVRDFPPLTGKVTCMTFLQDETGLIVGTDDNVLHVMDLNSGLERFPLVGHTSPPMTIAVTPDGARALSGGRDKSMRAWDVKNGKALWTLGGPYANSVCDIQVSADGRSAVLTAADCIATCPLLAGP